MLVSFYRVALSFMLEGEKTHQKFKMFFSNIITFLEATILIDLNPQNFLSIIIPQTIVCKVGTIPTLILDPPKCRIQLFLV